MDPARPLSQPTLRTSLIRASFALVLFALLAVIAGTYAFVYLPLAHDLATTQLRLASEQVEGRLRTLVDRVEAVARLNHEWGRRGLIDIDHPEHFDELLWPIIRQGPQLIAMVAAHESGRELLLLRAGDHDWSNRLTNPAGNPGRARFLTWVDGRLVRDYVEPLDYDARERPWFQGAMALADDSQIFWTAPYVFRSLREPGISAVVRWTGADGSRYAMSADIRLIDLSRFTRTLIAGKRGFVTVFTGDARVIGLPRDTRFDNDEAIANAVLKPVPEIGVAPLEEGYRLWLATGSRFGQTERLDINGTTWLASFRPFAFGSQTFWVATMAPEADFGPATSAQAVVLGAVVLGALLLAWFAASELARRFSQPLERLAAQSQRIGRLELDQPVTVDASWVEIDGLARAQEAMRVELLAATRRLSEANDLLEARVQERTQQLADARDAADAANRAKAGFLANMSHEIRTPINAMIGMTDLALRTPLSEKQRGYLTKARTAADTLLALINSILDFSKIDAGKLELDLHEFSLQDVLDRVTVVVGLKAHEKSLELLMNTAPDVPRRLIGDSLRLQQVLVNLCSNAVKFTEKGEIVLVTVKTMLSTDRRVTLRFSVRDTGPGMTEQQAASLFQPFNQLDPSTTRKFGGTGLGLAICKRLVALMGGEIGVSSQVGKGSDFHFTAEFGLPRVAGSLAFEAPTLPPVNVLIVDDSANAREILHALLTELNCTSTRASTSAAGIAEVERAASAGVGYEVVLVDWKMPEMDGFEFARHIRALRLSPAPRLVMVTAYGNEALIRQAAEQGLDGCLTKPVSSDALADAIETALRRAQPTPAAEAPQVVAAPATLAGRRILLVEDNEFNQIVASDLLREVAAADVAIARDGREAIAMLGEADFDAVLMDVQMPVMDGLQAAERIRRNAAYASLPIIAMTAHAATGDRERCLAAGMNDYVAKPFEAAELFTVLARWVATRERADSADASAVSIELGLQRCLGKVETYQKIVRRYLARATNPAREIQAELDLGQAQKASLAAHSLISTAEAIGAKSMADVARALEAAIDVGESARVAPLLERLAREHGRVRSVLMSYMAATQNT